MIWNIQAFNNSSFLILVALTVFGISFWVTYSFKEFLVSFEQNRKRKRIKHLKDLDDYRDKLKKRK